MLGALKEAGSARQLETGPPGGRQGGRQLEPLRPRRPGGLLPGDVAARRQTSPVTPRTPTGWPGSLAAAALLVGVLVHEVAHAVAARRAKLKVDGITLWFMGGVTRIEGDGNKPSTELVIALVGPLASGVLGGVSIGLSVLAQNSGWALAAGSLRWLGAINLLLGAFNLSPPRPSTADEPCTGSCGGPPATVGCGAGGRGSSGPRARRAHDAWLDPSRPPHQMSLNNG